MSISAHYIDDTWVLQNRILLFVYAPTPYTKEELARHLMDTFTKWNIETKISTITVDNCSTNDAVAVILDSRHKMKVVEFYFPMIYGENAWSEIEQVKTTCYNLFTDYQSQIKSKSNGTSILPTQVTETQASMTPNMSNLVALLSSSSTNVHVKSELNHYLDEPILLWMQEFDILNWWRTNGIKYPTLQLIAGDFLVVPVSTVASESTFSTGGKVVNIYQSRLREDTLEALMCSQNWLWVEIEAACSIEKTSCLCDVEEDVD
ncbi:hypothetical protein GH714_000957 [Hevea brasiliensis]|uniref:HAT C-terminal dimerisation domain-containing protein n=1 Tax=Hevea brasiliensis TaxID=3981 RepID=A0A6A6LAL8_HEVBR|nr:hypothetical protein GH714_000957 [Hevea brasiliensis]